VKQQFEGRATTFPELLPSGAHRVRASSPPPPLSEDCRSCTRGGCGKEPSCPAPFPGYRGIDHFFPFPPASKTQQEARFLGFFEIDNLLERFPPPLTPLGQNRKTPPPSSSSLAVAVHPEPIVFSFSFQSSDEGFPRCWHHARPAVSFMVKDFPLLPSLRSSPAAVVEYLSPLLFFFRCDHDAPRVRAAYSSRR